MLVTHALIGSKLFAMHRCNEALLCAQVMAPNRKIFALKRIKLQGRDAEAASGFIDEISLLERLRGGADYREPRTIDVHVRHLREKIELDPREPTLILTVRGVGYRFRER